jgi:hypothetical protein
MMLSDLLKTILTSAVTYLVASVLLPATVVLIPKFRDWLLGERDISQEAGEDAGPAGTSEAKVAIRGREGASEGAAQSIARLKKPAMAEAAEKALVGKPWLPMLLRLPLQA